MRYVTLVVTLASIGCGAILGLDDYRGADGGGAGVGPDAGPSSQTLACNGAVCGAGQACCIAPTTPASTSFTFQCTDPGAACGDAGAALLHCVSSTGCPATAPVCCIAAAALFESTCKAACAADEAELCDLIASSPACACSSHDITDWGLPETAGYATCGGRGR